MAKVKLLLVKSHKNESGKSFTYDLRTPENSLGQYQTLKFTSSKEFELNKPLEIDMDEVNLVKRTHTKKALDANGNVETFDQWWLMYKPMFV
jgi:uncharacterized protein YajQ (UPF0234 family)